MLFRKDMMLGRVLRIKGEFAESLMHLEKSRGKQQSSTKDLNFDEGPRDLTCDLELADPASAEHHLRAENRSPELYLFRRQISPGIVSSGVLICSKTL